MGTPKYNITGDADDTTDSHQVEIIDDEDTADTDNPVPVQQLGDRLNQVATPDANDQVALAMEDVDEFEVPEDLLPTINVEEIVKGKEGEIGGRITLDARSGGFVIKTGDIQGAGTTIAQVDFDLPVTKEAEQPAEEEAPAPSATKEGFLKSVWRKLTGQQ